jgi:hypothetical protein
MTIAGLVAAYRERTDEGRSLKPSYRTSLNHFDELLGEKFVGALSALERGLN